MADDMRTSVDNLKFTAPAFWLSIQLSISGTFTSIQWMLSLIPSIMLSACKLGKFVERIVFSVSR